MTRFIIRRDTAESWAEIDPVLDELEPALDTTNDIMKLGDGVHTWKELPEYRRDGVERVLSELRKFLPEWDYPAYAVSAICLEIKERMSR